MRYFLLTLSAVIFFLACNKHPKVNPSMENMLRTGKWKLSSGKVTVRKPNGKDTTLDYMKFIPDCYKDDYLVFDSLHYGRRFTSTVKCSPADPDYFVFNWQLKGNNDVMDLYNGYNYIYGIVDTVQPYKLDTLAFNPYVFDTIIGALDTLEGYTKVLIQLDTIRTLFFSGVPAGTGNVGPKLGGFDITDADIIDFSQSSFTLKFQLISYYTDSTNYHTASYLLPLDHTQNPDPNPDSFATIRPDTFTYQLIYTNY